MKPRHATALALVGWYLIFPPYSPDLKGPDKQKPFVYWTYVDECDSAEECEVARKSINGPDIRRFVVQNLKSQKRVTMVAQCLAASRCIEQYEVAR